MRDVGGAGGLTRVLAAGVAAEIAGGGADVVVAATGDQAK
jgi:hypothetical protein